MTSELTLHIWKVVFFVIFYNHNVLQFITGSGGTLTSSQECNNTQRRTEIDITRLSPSVLINQPLKKAGAYASSVATGSIPRGGGRQAATSPWPGSRCGRSNLKSEAPLRLLTPRGQRSVTMNRFHIGFTEAVQQVHKDHSSQSVSQCACLEIIFKIWCYKIVMRQLRLNPCGFRKPQCHRRHRL